MQESCSHGSVGERGGNEPLYPEPFFDDLLKIKELIINGNVQ